MRTLLLAAVALSVMAGPGTASAFDWRPEQTVEVVHGAPQPDVAVSADGRAALVFSQRGYSRKPDLDLWVRRANLPEPFIPGAATPPGGATDPRIAMSPEGVTAVAALEAGRIFVTMYPASPQARYRGKVVAINAPGVADEPLLDIDSQGRATVVWASPPRVNAYGFDMPRQVYAVTVGPGATLGPVQALGAPGNCDPSFDMNLRGDAAVAVSCSDRDDLVFYRPAGGSFGAGQKPFEGPGTIQVAVDGGGIVHAVQTSTVDKYVGKYPDFEWRLAYSARTAGGTFSQQEPLSRPGATTVGPLDIEAQENGRVIAGWLDGGRFVYAVRSRGGRFGHVASAGVADARASARDGNWTGGLDVVASPNGPVLLTWYDPQRVNAAIVEPGGSLTSPFRGVRGPFPSSMSPPGFAINDSGQVAGAWEQLCDSPDGAQAVMAVQRDVGGTPKAPPCQDMAPPRVIAALKRARVRGRRLRARVACNEVCNLTASARVLVASRRRPLATAKTARERRLPALRGAWVGFRLSAGEARRVRRALRARRKVTLRLSVSVRDVYGSGRRWRLRLPVAR